ncbi:hypothetical protein [Streptomyces sp. NPDC018045]|uniref:hypothetical protein n=1 Tax=Streptomyces sp. NPDC018045 TaxID=3365037 RepID=UPI0037945BA0
MTTTQFLISTRAELTEEDAKHYGEVLASVARGFMPNAKVLVHRSATLKPEWSSGDFRR